MINNQRITIFLTALLGYSSQADKVSYIPSSGTASTTRYWDCSGGACGCGFGTNNRYEMCHSNALFAAPQGNQYGAKFYGTAALSAALGGGNWQAEGCGKCFKVTA